MDTPMVALADKLPIIVILGFTAVCPLGVSSMFAVTAVATEEHRSDAILVATGSGVVAAAMIVVTVRLVMKVVRVRSQSTGSRCGLIIDGFGIWWRERERCFPIAWGELAEVTIGSKQMWGGNAAIDMYFVLKPIRPEEFWCRHPGLHSHHDGGAYWIHAPATGWMHGRFRQSVLRFAPHLWRAGAHRNPFTQAKAEFGERLM
ncbi:hypothetical protein ACFQ3B_18650 [Stackebrandtia endophytica]|nr:hypothetical protein [Stackebrandtia endophytica]